MHMHQTSPCLCTTLRKASRAITRIYDEHLAGSGMTTTQFAILRNLAREGDMSLSRLAELLVMDRTSLYRTIDPIERHGWVAIAPAPQGRAKIARLTQAGQAALDGALGAWEAAQTSMAGAIGTPALSALEAQLSQLVAVSRDRAL